MLSNNKMSANDPIIDTALLFLLKNVSPPCRAGDTGSRFMQSYIYQKFVDIKKNIIRDKSSKYLKMQSHFLTYKV